MNSKNHGHFTRALFSFLLVLSILTTTMPPQVAQAAITDASTLDMIASTVSILERIVSAVQEFFGEDSVAQTTSGGNQGNGGNHPYLLFTDADVATLRANANDSTSFNYSYWQQLKNKCAGDIGTIGSTFSASGPPSVNSITNGARDLRDLAICSVLHSDAATRDRYITAVRQELIDMSSWSSWGIQNVGGVIYFIGRGYINIAIAYDIAYDSFTTSSQITARTNLEKLFYKEMVNTLYYNDEDWGTRSLNERLGNHNVHAYTSMLAIGLAIKNANIPSLSVSIQGIIDKGRAGVDNILLFNYDRDGAAFEDINYHPETVARYAYMAFEIYKNVLGNDPFQRKTWGGARPALQGYTDFHSQMLFPWLQTWPSFLDGSVCNQDSNGAVCIANPFLPYILATEHYSDRVAAWYIERIKSKGKSPNDEEAVFGSLWGNKLTPQTPSAAGRPALFQSYNAPKNSANSDAYGAGYTFMRTGFEDEKDIQLVSRAIDSAAFHGHSNHGSFILNAFGTQFITDYFNAYGRDGGGYTDNLNYAFQQSGKGHNSVLACNSTLSVCEGSAYQHDNPAPNRRDIFFEQISTIPESTAFSTGEYDRVTMDLTRAYQLNSENANVTDAKRHIIFIREGGRKGYFVVIDDFSSSTGYRWQQRYHYAENAGGVRSKTFVTPSITDNNRYQLTKIGATSPKLFIQQIYPTSGTTASIESRPNQYDTSETLGRWIQTTTNNASTRFVRVSLMYPSENGAAPSVAPTISGSKITVAVDGRSVTYDQSAKTVSVNTGGTTPTTYACSDGVDNDSPADGLIDYPADPGCTSATDNDEYNLPPASAVTCSPSSQSRVTGQSASFTASGGSGTFSWTATGGSPASGTGASFSTTYSSTGTKTVTVSSNSTSASCSVSVTTAPTSGSEIVPGRIAISSDGNHHDYDDVLATAETVALLAKTGQSSKLVYYGYSDHHWISSTSREAQMEDSGLETARMWNNAGAANFTLSNFYSATARNSSGNPIPNQTALNKLVAEINASTASNPLWLIAAGPMDIVGRAMNAANSTARQYVHLISHSNWNNTHSDNPDSGESVQHTGWTWAEMQSSFGPAKFHYLNDQNGGLNDDYSAYTWLRDSSDSKLRWIWCRSQGTKCAEFSSYTAGAGKGTFDDSDTGMAYWLISGGYKNTGDTNSRTNTPSTIYGDSNATPAKLRALFTQAQCNNLIDDDGDGAIDTADSGCSGTGDNSEGGTSSGGDTTNPSVSISSPAAGATVSGTITFSATATDNVGVTRVEFYRGTTLISSDTSSPYTTSWNTTSVANGSYSLTARAYDAAGNMNTSAAVSVNVNNGTTPTPVTCSPSSQSRITGQAASFTAGGGNGTYAWSATGGSPSTGSGSSFSTTYSSTGTKTVTVSSNSTSASCSVSVTTAPSTGAQCGNGIDDADTEDTLVDMNDPGCGIATDTDESNPTPITRFTNGTRVMVSTSFANIRPYAGDNTSPSPQQSQGALGTVTAGPKWGILNGNGFWYWQVNFDSGTDGWAGDNNLAPATVQPPTTCADGLDNDGDALVDLADPGCTSATDTDEYNAPPQGTAAVTALTLVNADLNDPNNTGSADLIDISNNADIGLGYFPGVTNLSIRAKTSGTVSKVAFTLNGATKSTESLAPYALEGDTNGNYNNWSYAFNATYTVVATPYNSSGVAATPLTVTFTLKQGSVTYRCADGVDNDNDGKIDYPADIGCISANDDDETNPVAFPACSDGLDNDDDGKVDYGTTTSNDPGCTSATDTDEYNAPPVAQCADSIDNDSDGAIDYPNDPGCTSSTDNDEYNAPPTGSTTFSVGQTVTPTFQVNVRATAGGTLLGTHNPGDLGVVVGGPVSAAGYWYWQIDFATAPDGWSAEDFLVAVNTPVSYACSDAIDNDGDGLVDLVDPGCSSSADNDEYNAPAQTAAACANGTDDDGDGRVDMNDPGCGIATDTDESNPTPITRFTNGTRVMVSTSFANIRPYAGDNTSPSPQQSQGALGTVTAGPKWGILNGNGFWYWQVNFDSGTDGWAGDNNLAPASTSSTDTGSNSTASTYACSDGIDNDGDGSIDFPSDYGCTSATDTSETNPVSSADIKAKPSNSGAYTGGAITITSGSTASVQWSSINASSCTVTSTPSANTWTGSSGTQTTTVLLGQTTYTLTCYQSDMVASTDSVIINTIIPVACADGIDNDNDGAIDYPADSGCASATDDDEVSPVFSDTTAPIITNVSATSPNGDTLIVSWTTNEPSTSQVAYGATSVLGELTDKDPRYETAHSVTITGLERKTTYYIQVMSVDSVGNDGSGTIISAQTIARLSKSPKVTNLTASAGSIILRWNNPTEYEYWRGTIVLRDEDQFVNIPSESLALYSGTGTEFRDTTAQAGVPYYYTVYTFDDQGQYSDPEFIAYQLHGSTTWNDAPSDGGNSSVALEDSSTNWNDSPSTSTNYNSDGSEISLEGPQSAYPGVCSVTTPGITITRWLELGSRGEDVRTLQQYLNKIGHTVATAGPGAPGQETDFFGRLTDTAVKKFQCETLGVCSGSPYTTGHGGVGPRTRAALANSRTTQQCTSDGDSPPGLTGTGTPDQIQALQRRLEELKRQLEALLSSGL